jgi:hypothetical protein
MSGQYTALRTPAAFKTMTPASKADRKRRQLPTQADALSTRSKRSNVGRGTSRSLASALSCGLPLLEPRCPEICTFFDPIPGWREAVEGASCRRGLWSRGRERQRRVELSLRVDAGNSDRVPGLNTQLGDCWQDNNAAVDLGFLSTPDRSSQVARWPTYGSRKRQGHKTTRNPAARGRLAARPSEAPRPSDTGRPVTVRNDDAPARYSHPFQTLSAAAARAGHAEATIQSVPGAAVAAAAAAGRGRLFRRTGGVVLSSSRMGRAHAARPHVDPSAASTASYRSGRWPAGCLCRCPVPGRAQRRRR